MKRMKRSWALGIVLVFAWAAVLSACGGNNGKPSAANGSASPSASAPASESPSASAGAPGIAKPRVAFVYIGPPGDGGWTYQHDEGRKYMEKELGIQADTVENVPESADAERVIGELAQNHDIIFTTSFGYMDQTLNVAKKFPNVKFEHVAGYKTTTWRRTSAKTGRPAT